jgi:hypothetical protein
MGLTGPTGATVQLDRLNYRTDWSYWLDRSVLDRQVEDQAGEMGPTGAPGDTVPSFIVLFLLSRSGKRW